MARSFSSTGRVYTGGFNIPSALSVYWWAKPGNAWMFAFQFSGDGARSYMAGSDITLTREFSPYGNWYCSGLTYTGWHHYCWTHDGTTGSPAFYLDGVAQTVSVSSSPGSTPETTSQVLSIGNHSNGGSPWGNAMGHFGMHNAVLTVGQVQEAMLNGFCPDSSLIGYWPLYGEDSPEPDLSGLKKTGTVTGTTRVSDPPIHPGIFLGSGVALAPPPAGTTYDDSASGTLTLSGSVAESYGYSDSASGTIPLSAALTDSAAYSDGGSGVVSLNGTASDSAVYDDYAGPLLPGGLPGGGVYPGGVTLSLTGTATESFATGGYYEDSPSGAIELSGSVTESQSRDESTTGTIPLSGITSEARSGDDTASGTLPLVGTSTESYRGAESVSGILPLAGSLSENFIGPVVYTDTCSGVLELSGSVVNGEDRSESVSGTIPLTGSSDEHRGYPDTATGVLTLAGFAVESISYSASPSGVLTLTGEIKFEPPWLQSNGDEWSEDDGDYWEQSITSEIWERV